MHVGCAIPGADSFSSARDGHPLAPRQKGLTFKVEPGDGKTPCSFVRLDIFRDDVLVRSEPFGNHSDVFEKFWGDPQQPPFIIVRTGMRSVLYDLILPWWKPHSVTYRYISYVSREGVIGGRYLYSISRADSETGSVRWERIFQIGVAEVGKTNRGVWTTLGDGRQLLLDWRTGKTIARATK